MGTLQRTVAATLLTALAACGGETFTTDAIVTRDSSGVAIVENDLLRLDASCSVAAEPTLSIGEEEGGDEYELSRVFGATRLSDGRIVIANNSTWQLRYYGADGRYIRSSGRQGEGPGEFRDPWFVHTLSGDTVYAGDYDPWRFLVFGPDGEWVRTVTATPFILNSPEYRGVLADGRMMLAVGASLMAPTGQFVAESLSVQVHDANGLVTDTIVTLANGRRGEIVPGSRFRTQPMFESYAFAAAWGQAIAIAHGSEREFRVYDTAAGIPLARVVRWSGESRDVTSDDVAAERERERKYLAGFPTSALTELMEKTQLSEQRPIADVLPAMNALMIGTDGRIWVRAYSMPADTGARTWVAFTSEGAFDCGLRLPRSYGSVAELGPDYLLVMHEDSLGVERVKQFQLSKP